MDLTGWAEQQGLQKRGARAVDWLRTRPELLGEAIRGREDGWSWETIRAWLAAEHGFPFTTTSLINAVRTLGL